MSESVDVAALLAKIASLEQQLGTDEEDGKPPADRDTWVTPLYLARAVGRWDLDPCSNDRSHLDAAKTFRLDRGQDGLVLAPFVSSRTRVWINPPYSDVMPWIKAYGHTRFCFLVKFDPSTKWCRELIKRTELVLFPTGKRIAFEPPPGVEGASNQFPHGLFYARADDATDAISALCTRWRIER